MTFVYNVLVASNIGHLKLYRFYNSVLIIFINIGVDNASQMPLILFCVIQKHNFNLYVYSIILKISLGVSTNFTSNVMELNAWL